MKFIFTTVVKNVYDHTPILSGRKNKNPETGELLGEPIFEHGLRVKRVVTDELSFELQGDTAPSKGSQLRVTIETI